MQLQVDLGGRPQRPMQTSACGLERVKERKGARQVNSKNVTGWPSLCCTCSLDGPESPRGCEKALHSHPPSPEGGHAQPSVFSLFCLIIPSKNFGSPLGGNRGSLTLFAHKEVSQNHFKRAHAPRDHLCTLAESHAKQVSPMRLAHSIRLSRNVVGGSQG